MKKDKPVSELQETFFSFAKDSALAYWQQRDLRERRLLIAAFLAVAAAIIYSVLIDPALSGRADLQEEIPQLRQQAAEMAVLSKQSAQLNTAMAENIPAITRETVEASLVRWAVKPQALTVSDDVVRLQLPSIAYSSLMEWLLEMQKSARLTVDEARVTALPEPGMVGATLTLRQQRNAS
ncbi:type II secretion system protein GspM [Undibacterium sp.]|jgi:general secretion pathway protein M|uniref:type II secretion system protein GspM n=1 Tax=Undibacterium sp. TaxID=1914977 RepID=UPI002BEE9805|nr:type II secretion system protein GspM [Undibacterium sp.]HTD02352.1 type II secretion system protein GspM [Undibacterium sp.]